MGQRRPYSHLLSARFAFLLAIALLPLGVVSIIQTRNLQREAEARVEAALIGAALRAASQETELILRTQGVAAALAAGVLSVINDPKACADMMVKVAAVEKTATLVAFIPANGLMTCSNTGATHDFSASPRLKALLADRKPAFTVNRNATISKTSVLGISYPVIGADDTVLGLISISLPHEAMAALKGAMTGDPKMDSMPVDFWTFDETGELLAADIDLDQVPGLLPDNRPLISFVGLSEQVFRSTNPTGTTQTYAVVPLVAGQLYLMATWQHIDLPFFQRYADAPYLYPVLMWALSFIVAGLAAERLVNRHIRVLSQSIVNFSKGNRRLEDLDLSAAPGELRDLGVAYLAMTETITKGEADLEDIVRQKDVLLREVHHRVKNNLQLISSIMNIQIRHAQSAEAKTFLKSLQDRVMSLATIHRSLYQTKGLDEVPAKDLLPDILRQILAMSSGAERPFDVKTDIDDIALMPDQAVPLSLLVTEALTNTIKHSGATRSAPGMIRLSLKRSDRSAVVLEIVNSFADMVPGPGDVHSGIGTKLITAFAQQLGGQLLTTVDGPNFRLTLTWNLATRQDDAGDEAAT